MITAQNTIGWGCSVFRYSEAEFKSMFDLLNKNNLKVGRVFMVLWDCGIDMSRESRAKIRENSSEYAIFLDSIAEDIHNGADTFEKALKMRCDRAALCHVNVTPTQS